MQAASDGRCTTAEEDAAIEAVGGERSALYGEITPLGFRALSARLQLGSSDVFADLGSGLGRATVQAVREYSVRLSFGVEMAATRHELAEAALADASDCAAIGERVRLLCADCSDDALWTAPDAPLRDVTVIYMGALMFSADLMRRLARLIEQLPAVRVVASLKRFADGDAPAGFREDLPTETVETSWTAPQRPGEGAGVKEPGCPVHVYLRESDV